MACSHSAISTIEGRGGSIRSGNAMSAVVEASKLKIRKSKRYNFDGSPDLYRYDASWDTPTGGKQTWVESQVPCDELARSILERAMRKDNGNPNSAEYVLELPPGIEAEWI